MEQIILEPLWKGNELRRRHSLYRCGEGTKVKAVYGGIGIWFEKKELE